MSYAMGTAVQTGCIKFEIAEYLPDVSGPISYVCGQCHKLVAYGLREVTSSKLCSIFILPNKCLEIMVRK